MAKKKNTDTVLSEAIADITAKLPPPNLSMGIDLFDLAVGDKVGAALGPGRYMWLRGASSSGKSFLTLAILAEATRNPAYKDHNLYYVDGELGAAFDLQQFFGSRTAARVERVEDIGSIERFYDRMSANAKKGPFVAVLDSFDSLLPESRLKAIEKAAQQREEGKDVDGSYAMEHAKIHSERLRILVKELGETGSVFLGISQLRDNVNAGLYGPKTISSGGKALKFWASVEVETASSGKITRKVRDVERTVAKVIKVDVDKNRITGKTRSVLVPFIEGYGICNTGASLDWLVAEKYIPKSKDGRISFPGYDATYYREDLIRKIEDDGKEPELRALLEESWSDLEAQMKMPRKSRYE